MKFDYKYFIYKYILLFYILFYKVFTIFLRKHLIFSSSLRIVFEKILKNTMYFITANKQVMYDNMQLYIKDNK